MPYTNQKSISLFNFVKKIQNGTNIYLVKRKSTPCILNGNAPRLNFFNTHSYRKIIVYRNFNLVKPNGGKRNINDPGKTLKSIQKVILRSLSRIETPDWLISGKRRRSYISNGIFHKE